MKLVVWVVQPATTVIVIVWVMVVTALLTLVL